MIPTEGAMGKPVALFSLKYVAIEIRERARLVAFGFGWRSGLSLRSGSSIPTA